MRWRTGRRSTNVEDRRGVRAGRGLVGGGIGTIIIVVLALYFGLDPALLMQGLPTDTSLSTSQPIPSGQDELVDFVSVVLADTEDTWHALFNDMGGAYQEPHLVLFSGAVQSACGFARAAVGPFYCPADQKVYVDLSFYDDLRRRYRAPGDFAQAYVIAHEIGHHVQTLLGISEQVHAARRRASDKEYNALSVRMELQADCLAGVWAHHADRARGILESGDIEEALTAASAIGDDRLQRQSQGYVAPDSFTHGSSEQRMRWFSRGMREGSLNVCDTFSVADL